MGSEERAQLVASPPPLPRVQGGQHLSRVTQAEDEVVGGSDVGAVADGSCTSSKTTSVKPAAVRMASVLPGSPSENGFAPAVLAGGGAPRALRIAPGA